MIFAELVKNGLAVAVRLEAGRVVTEMYEHVPSVAPERPVTLLRSMRSPEDSPAIEPSSLRIPRIH